MKGQYLTVEYIIFFIIGLTLVVSVYLIFTNVNQIAERNTIRSQLKSVGEIIRETIINIVEVSSSTKSEINYNLTIPPKLSTCIYVIEAYSGLNLNCTHDTSIGTVISLYNINITTKNIIYSTKGYVQINAYNDWVELK